MIGIYINNWEKVSMIGSIYKQLGESNPNDRLLYQQLFIYSIPMIDYYTSNQLGYILPMIDTI